MKNYQIFSYTLIGAGSLLLLQNGVQAQDFGTPVQIDLHNVINSTSTSLGGGGAVKSGSNSVFSYSFNSAATPGNPAHGTSAMPISGCNGQWVTAVSDGGSFGFWIFQFRGGGKLLVQLEAKYRALSCEVAEDRISQFFANPEYTKSGEGRTSLAKVIFFRLVEKGFIHDDMVSMSDSKMQSYWDFVFSEKGNYDLESEIFRIYSKYSHHKTNVGLQRTPVNINDISSQNPHPASMDYYEEHRKTISGKSKVERFMSNTANIVKEKANVVDDFKAPNTQAVPPKATTHKTQAAQPLPQNVVKVPDILAPKSPSDPLSELPPIRHIVVDGKVMFERANGLFSSVAGEKYYNSDGTEITPY